MSVPKYNDFFTPILLSLEDGKEHNIKEIKEFCIRFLNLSEEDKQEQLSSGRNKVYDRISWARTYLKKAGLIDTTERAIFKLTEDGKKAILNGAQKVNLEYLKQFESFRNFIKTSEIKTIDTDPIINNESPQERLEKAIKEINFSLADDLMSQIMKISPYDFEKLVIKLLIKMGYCTLELNEQAITKKSKDNGIDGIISSDRFGLDKIYVQSKQWKNDCVIGRPEIQKFLGALAGQGATKGLFITTSKFSKEAMEFSKKQFNCKIVLVDGEELCNLMIEYNLGVSTYCTYYIKKIDYDFFNDEF